MSENTRNLFAILFIAVSLGTFAVYKTAFKSIPTQTFKVLRVVEGDKFYIDLNGNDRENEGELFRLDGASAFPLKYSQTASENAKKLGLSISEIISLGYGAREFSRDGLEGSFVTVEKAKIFLNNKDYSHILLENGFGFSDGYYNSARVKDNLKNLMAQEIMVVDNENKTYHEIDCPETLKIKNPALVPFKKITKSFKKCRKCYLKRDFERDLALHPVIIESPEPNLRAGQIELFLISPMKYFTPSNRCRTNACQALLKNVNEAKEEIGFAIYGFEKQDEIFDALKRAKARGVRVYGVTDTDSKGKFAYGDSEKYTKEFSLITDNSGALMHNKFFIFDNKKVFTGTMNISESGAGGYNSNTVVIINSPTIAAAYKNELDQMFSGRFQKKKSGAPPINDAEISLYFSPKGNIYENAIKPQIDNAKSEILVSAFFLTRKDMVEDLAAAQKRGVKIKAMIDATAAANAANKHEDLRKAGIQTKVENWGGKNHEKNMVIDSKIFIIGSANFSRSAVEKNDENLLVIKNPVVARKYREHFMKLYDSIDEKYLKETPHSESLESGNSCFDGIDNNFDGKIDGQDAGCKRRVLL